MHFSELKVPTGAVDATSYMVHIYRPASGAGRRRASGIRNLGPGTSFPLRLLAHPEAASSILLSGHFMIESKAIDAVIC